MDNTTTFVEWWHQTGAFELNEKLLQIWGEDIGDIPIENILENMPTDLPDYSIEELGKLLAKDGITSKVAMFEKKARLYIDVR